MAKEEFDGMLAVVSISDDPETMRKLVGEVATLFNDASKVFAFVGITKSMKACIPLIEEVMPDIGRVTTNALLDKKSFRSGEQTELVRSILGVLSDDVRGVVVVAPQWLTSEFNYLIHARGTYNSPVAPGSALFVQPDGTRFMLDSSGLSTPFGRPVGAGS